AGFFDHFVPYFADRIMPARTRDDLPLIAGGAGDLFIDSVLTYFPAKLGITPGSAVRLYFERVLESTFNRFVWLAMGQGLINTTHAYPQDSLPRALQDVWQYNYEKDKKAVEAIGDVYSRKIRPV